jgi:hypothetical protein
MSTGPEQEETTEAVDQVFPEDGVDIPRVKSLDDLGKVANVNTTQVRMLQRQLVQAREDPSQHHRISSLEEAIARRQQRGIKLIHQRTRLQEVEKAKKRNVVEEALRPTIGSLNNDRRTILAQVLDMQERIQKLRGKYTEQIADQRRLEAKLKQWDSLLLTMARGLDMLAPLPTDLD